MFTNRIIFSFCFFFKATKLEMDADLYTALVQIQKARKSYGNSDLYLTSNRTKKKNCKYSSPIYLFIFISIKILFNFKNRLNPEQINKLAILMAMDEDNERKDRLSKNDTVCHMWQQIQNNQRQVKFDSQL